MVVRDGGAPNADLRRGLLIHAAVFVIAMVALGIVNLVTREPDGDWWVLWVAEFWILPGALHLFGAAIGAVLRRLGSPLPLPSTSDQQTSASDRGRLDRQTRRDRRRA
ncbi:MAG: 2TM domain-containing protein [Actinomycetota bacterium]